MARRIGILSRTVAWARVVVPALALILLSTLFLITSGSRDPVPDMSPGDALDINREQIEAAARDIVKNRDSGDRALVAGISLDLESASGMRIRLAAEEGDILVGEDRAEFRKNVLVSTSTGYTLRADGLSADLSTQRIESTGPVTGEGPAGKLEAGRMVLERGATKDAPHVLVFKEGVRLIYHSGR